MRRILIIAALLAVAIGLVGLALAQEVKAPAPAEAKATPTRYPAGDQPDQIVLTWGAKPTDSASIQWRTNVATTSGALTYMPASAWNSFQSPRPTFIWATTEKLSTPTCSNDPECNRHTVRLLGLTPGTEYVYSVGDGTPENWSAVRSFRTAPSGAAAFSFIYMGDAQYGFSRWEALHRAAMRNRPDAAFVLMAGDQVTRGNDRDDWDDFLSHSTGLFDRLPVMPSVGNHECKGDGPALYRSLFDLPANGPEALDPERVYAVTYGNALFVTLDSNLPPTEQAAWLDATLGKSDATWKFVTFHHPLYSSEPKRDNAAVRETWGPIFDKHHVDLVFQGHDHAYLRTFPMKANKRVDSTAEGTIYLISVSGTKMYEQAQRDYTQVGFPQTATYSVIDILPADSKVADRLIYKAYDLDGAVKDEFVIDKTPPASGD